MSDSGAGNLVVKAARLYDGVSTEAAAGRALHLAGGRIAAVGAAEAIEAQIPPGTEVVDLGDACLTPGLIDTHTHVSLSADGRSYAQLFAQTDEELVLSGVPNLRRHLEAGVTTLRDNGARNQVAFTLKEGLRRGYIEGPRLLASGRSITCTEGHFHMCNEVADGELGLRRSVRRLVHQGADFIKVMASGGGTVGTLPGRASYSVEELAGAAAEAHHLGRLISAHCRAKEAMARAVEAGIDMVEHAEFLEPDMVSRFDGDLARRMKDRGTWIGPTLQARTGFPRLLQLERRAAAGQIAPGEGEELQQLQSRSEGPLGTVRSMVECGLLEQIVPGTDCGVGTLEFGHLDYDMMLLERAGFTAGEALRAATGISAKAVGLADQIGTLEVGKVADVAAFAGDPTRDLGALDQVVAVFQGGRRVR